MVCEGETEQQYFKQWERILKGKANFKILPNVGVPLTLVQTAISFRKQLVSEGTKASNLKTWCVGDLDDHPNVLKALDLARRKSVEFALSIPCLELWFYLHFKDQRSHIHRDDITRRSIAELGIKTKNNLTSMALERLIKETDQAIVRADFLENMHLGNGSGHLENPRSGIYRLVRELKSL